MKIKLLYLLIALVVLQILLHGFLNIITLVLAGVLLGILAEKEKKHELSLWKLIVGIVIGSTSLLLWIAKITNLIK
ncbi:MAG: hypothetical protein NTV98_04840 [Candidatus Roizmanbacteria bacterium]|nr:hypothetical protein [Candidatus Roizmanbacteria bacterium]